MIISKYKKTAIMIACSGFLLITAFFGPSIMAFLSSMTSADNEITTGLNTITLEKTGDFPAMPENGAASSGDAAVKITNTGDVPCYVRLKVIISNDQLAGLTTLQNLDLTHWSNKYIDPVGYDTGDNSSYDNGSNLYGYYYFEQPLGEGESTTELFNGVNIAAGSTDVMCYNYGISVYAESVQEGDSSSWEDAWEDFIV